ncbi:hypothetical protein DERP_012147 [Dermatophagoides pteronyssinus]|uniref:Uncharacterized protein n=1 Tax=Dermatophagoides pteronyssinus TaxID=6956 RepID=A0ABQ8J2B7_DERPT|nr:hypothetical protein DERP_012147 [Dermatophagoides pteronyssinus]
MNENIPRSGRRSGKFPSQPNQSFQNLFIIIVILSINNQQQQQNNNNRDNNRNNNRCNIE